jgi:hypothetical protein
MPPRRPRDLWLQPSYLTTPAFDLPVSCCVTHSHGVGLAADEWGQRCNQTVGAP